jgi:hypothetical protein
MKAFIHKAGAVLMTFVVLFSTMSFTIDMHYCGDKLVDASIFKKAKTCKMEMQKSKSDSECSIMKMKKDCCSDEQLIIDGQDELKLSFEKMTLDQQVFVTSFIYTYAQGFEDLQENKTSFLEYPPPLVVRQIFKLDESYLI